MISITLDSREYTKPPTAPLRVSEFIEGGSLMFLARFKDQGYTYYGIYEFC